MTLICSAGTFEPLPPAGVADILAQFAPTTRTVAELLVRQARSLGAREFLRFDTASYSFRDVSDRVARTAHLLRAGGIEAGDRVAIMCGNRVEFIDLFFACAWIGAVAVPINLSSRGPQLQHILKDSGARLLVADAEVVGTLAYLDRAALALQAVWVLAQADIPRLDDLALRAMPPLGQEAIASPVATSPADTAAIIYTSGTTGPSKGVCCPHGQFFWWGLNGIDVLEVTERDVLLTSLPLFHINALGSVFQALLSGATLVVLERFSARGFVPALHEHRATVTFLLGAMAAILLATPPSDRDGTHGVRVALAPGVPKGFWAEFGARYGIGFIDGYGSTETNFIIGDRLADQTLGAMGRVRPGFSARVVDPQGFPVPAGTPGELVVRSDHPHAMASGYFGLAEATAESRRDLWFHTGDRVYCAPDGRFYFMDRMKDAIRRRGENISAYEVEQVVLSHPAVAYAAVYPVPSELAEDEVMVAAVLKPGEVLSAEELLDFCQPRMSYFAVPRYVLFADDLPKTDNGKVQKFKLREAGVTVQTWDREAAGYTVSRPGKPA
ncbi:MAG: ATP-dependent acyl-CoA ligase [Novosphingobium sp.]